MSLINEALKRTRDASYQAPPPRPISAEPYRVAATPAPPRRSPRVALGLGLAAGVLLLVAVGYVYYHRFAPATPVVVPPPPPVAESPVSPPVVEELPAEPPPAPVAPPPEPVPPKLVLQGITGDATEREAMINGTSLRVGEEIDGAKVLAINARAVKLQFAGKEIQLRMP